MTTIYLIRHAEAEGNLYRIAQGQDDSILTDRGWRQVKALERRFEGVQIDEVYASDLYRTRATASAICRPRNLTPHLTRDLREIHVGVWERKTWGEIVRRWPEEMERFGRQMDRWRMEGAETPAQVLERALEAVRKIAAENDGKTVAVFSHGYVIRLLLADLQGISLRDTGAKSPTGDNTAVSLLEAEGDDIRVVFRDDASHLPAAVSTFRRQSWHKDDAATEPGLWFRAASEGDGTRTEEALLEEEVSGTISMALEPEALRITDYQLVPALRGQRYGIQLLGQAVQYARTRGREALVLRCPEELKGYFAKYGFVSSGAEMVMDLRRIVREIPSLG